MICPRCGGTGEMPDGADFRKLRKDAGLRLWQVSAESGLSVMYVSELERGRKPMSRNHAIILDAAIEKLARGE